MVGVAFRTTGGRPVTTGPPRRPTLTHMARISGADDHRPNARSGAADFPRRSQRQEGDLRRLTTATCTT